MSKQMSKGLKFNEIKCKVAEIINVLTKIMHTAVENVNYSCKILTVCICIVKKVIFLFLEIYDFFRTLK